MILCILLKTSLEPEQHFANNFVSLQQVTSERLSMFKSNLTRMEIQLAETTLYGCQFTSTKLHSQLLHHS